MAKQAKDTPFQQVQIPKTEQPLNVVPVPNGSTLRDGSLASRNFRHKRSGFRLSSDGTIEAQDGIFSGTFNIGNSGIERINTFFEVAEKIQKLRGTVWGLL